MNVTGSDAEAVVKAVRRAENDELVRTRTYRNVYGPAPAFSRKEFWYVMLGCLLTTRQRSTKGSPVETFLSEKPFPLELGKCAEVDVRRFVRKTIAESGGIRFAPTIAARAEDNFRWLYSSGWEQVERIYKSLGRQRSQKPRREHAAAERKAARFIDESLEGFGPKQSRNLWQWLGLTRYEIPLDSRVADWINANLSQKIDVKRLSNASYYDSVLDYVQTVCSRAKVLPCIFDAAAFDFEDKDEREGACVTTRGGAFQMSRKGKGTTDPGRENPNGQIVVRDTGLPGTDYGQHVYELRCKHCGNAYGADGSDVHERKCPVCQEGRPGIPLART